MKKILILSIIFILVLSFSACTTDETDDNDEVNDNGELNDTENDDDISDNAEDIIYQDGSYDGEGDEWDYGKENATVVIEDGEIFDITLRRLDKEGNEVNYDNWTGEEVNGKVYPNLKKYREDMAKQMLDNQTWDVDTISGATISTSNWRLAVKRALEKAKTGE